MSNYTVCLIVPKNDQQKNDKNDDENNFKIEKLGKIRKMLSLRIQKMLSLRIKKIFNFKLKKLFLVFDCSGSMRSFMEKINEALHRIIDDYPDSIDIIIILYACRSRSFTSMEYPRNFNGRLVNISDIGVGCSTNFSSFVVEINKHLDKYESECLEFEPILYIFSDGASNSDDNYQNGAEKLVLRVNQLGGKINPIQLGSSAKLMFFGQAVNMDINELSEYFMGIYSDLNNQIEGILINFTNQMKIKLSELNGVITGSCLLTFDIDFEKKVFLQIGDEEIELKLTNSINDEDDRIENITKVLETMVFNNQNVVISNLVEVINELRLLNKSNGDDPRIRNINIHVDKIINLLKEVKTSTSFNILENKNIGSIISMFLRLLNAMTTGKRIRKISGAVFKLTKWIEQSKNTKEFFNSLEFPQRKKPLCDSDALLMDVDVPTVMFCSVISNSSSDDLSNLFELMSTKNFAIAAKIDNPAGALISASNNIFCLETLFTLHKNSQLERIVYGSSAAFFPYSNHDIEWLMKAYQYYAGVLIVGHPIKTSSKSGLVFLSAISSILNKIEIDSLHNMKVVFFFYGYAYAYSQSKYGDQQIFDIISNYSAEPLSIYKSRSFNSNNLLMNIQVGLGSLMILTSPQLNSENKTINFHSCFGLIKSIIMENIRQYLKTKYQTIYDDLVMDLQKQIGFYDFVDDLEEQNFSDFLLLHSEILKKISLGVENPKKMVDIVFDLISVKLDLFEPNLSNGVGFFEKYLPSSTNYNALGLVPSYYSMSELEKMIKLIKSMSEIDWLSVSNEFLGYVPDDFCELIFQHNKSKIITDEMIFEILNHLALTNGNPLKTEYSNNSYKSLPLPLSIKNINKKRLETFIDELLNFAFEISDIDVLLLHGLLIIKKSITNIDFLKSTHVCDLISRFSKLEEKQKIEGHELILKLIGIEILSENIQMLIENAGISKLLIEKHIIINLVRPSGVILPKLRHISNHFQKIMRLIPTEILTYNSDDDKQIYEYIYENALNLINVDFNIISIKKEDLFGAIKTNPSLLNHGAYHAMVKFNKLIFVNYEKNDLQYFLCLGIDGFTKKLVKEHNNINNGKYIWDSECYDYYELKTKTL